MNAPSVFSRVARPLGVGVIGLLCVGLLLATPGRAAAAATDVAAATATPNAPALAAASRPVFAAWYQDVLGNQTRMIQVTTLFMIAGIMFLMWTRGK